MFEKVNPSHPDKIADRIAGALVDMAYRTERNPRIAVEVLIGRYGQHIRAEGVAYDHLQQVVRAEAHEVGNLEREGRATASVFAHVAAIDKDIGYALHTAKA